ncbi:MAG: chemotaxis protein CheX [Clostridiaceae bacterium]|nr:chemotaxis protein CheX [Clostridiaceae bacterium]
MYCQLVNIFINSVKETYLEMAGINIDIEKDFYTENEDLTSMGVTSIISFSGKINGRLLLDMEKNLAIETARNITGTVFETVNEGMVLESIQRINNTIAKEAIERLNNQYSLELSLASPVVFTGKEIVISVPKAEPLSADCSTLYGKMKVNISFEEVLF